MITLILNENNLFWHCEHTLLRLVIARTPATASHFEAGAKRLTEQSQFTFTMI